MSEPTAAPQAPAPLPFTIPPSADVLSIDVRADLVRAHVMMDGYMKRYASDPTEWELVGCEVPFTGEIINPETGAASRTFVMAGIFDKIMRRKEDGTLWLWEHKTTSTLNGSYLERLWLDNQITLYSIYAQRKYGQPIAGVVYDVLAKSKIEWKPGETESEFEARKLGMKQPGRAKRQAPDTVETFARRLLEGMADPESMKYHREPIMFGRDDLEEQAAEIWELTKAYLHSRERAFWPKNTSQCFVYNRRCEFHAICASRGNPVTIETMYRLRQGHRELAALGIVDESGHLPGDKRTVVTNSFLGAFRNCQRMAKLRYIDSLEIIGTPAQALTFGKVIHAALECWDNTHDPAKVRAMINDEFHKPQVSDAYASPALPPGATAADAFFDLPEF